MSDLRAAGRQQKSQAEAALTIETHIGKIFAKLGLEPELEDHRRVLALLATQIELVPHCRLGAVRIRQVVLVAKDLEPAVDVLCRQLGLEVCYRDPGVAHFGLHNALMAVGDCFIEVVSPTREGTAAGRYLERRNGDGGYMLILQVDDLDRERARLEALGTRIVWEARGDGINGVHLHPADVGGAIVSLDVAAPPGSWGWAGADWQGHVRDDVVRGVAGVELQSEDPEGLALRWAEVLGRQVERAIDHDEAVLNLDGGVVRFVPAGDGRGEGIGGFDLVASDRSRAGEIMELAGIRVRLL